MNTAPIVSKVWASRPSTTGRVSGRSGARNWRATTSRCFVSLAPSPECRDRSSRFKVSEDDHPEPEGDPRLQEEAIIVKKRLKAEEREILEHFERGELTRASGAQREMETARQENR